MAPARPTFKNSLELRNSAHCNRHCPRAAPDDVFETIVNPHRLPDWNRAIARVLDAPETLAAGDEWVVEMHALGQCWPSRSRVEVIDPVAWHFSYRSNTDDGNPSYTEWSWKVREAEGGCRHHCVVAAQSQDLLASRTAGAYRGSSAHQGRAPDVPGRARLDGEPGRKSTANERVC